jgi:hypothetical protein
MKIGETFENKRKSNNFKAKKSASNWFENFVQNTQNTTQ